MAPQTGVLSFAQIKTYAQAAGFSGNDLNVAVAVAFAESSGNPRAKNYVPCYGLWQINMREPMGAARRKKYHLMSNEDLYNPATNAKAAYGIYKDAGSTFKPWTTYTGGAYKKYMSYAQKAESSQDLIPKLDKVQQVQQDELAKLGPWVMIANGIKGFTEGFRQAAITYMVVLIVIVMVVLGIILVNQKSIGKVAGTAAKVVL